MFKFYQANSQVKSVLTLSLAIMFLAGCSSKNVVDDTPAGSTLSLIVSPATIETNTTAIVTATVTSSGTPLANRVVNFTVSPSTSGYFTPTADTTDASGVGVLSPVEPGLKTLSVSGGGVSGLVTISIANKDLQELAIALNDSGASLMANVQYAFGEQVVEITPSMSLAEVNSALPQSNTIVFFRAGTYTGDLQFSGSNVTLFGVGPQG